MRPRWAWSSVALALLLLGAIVADAASWYRPATCTDDCDSSHTCMSSICTQAWDACPEQHVETRREDKADKSDCKENECAWGGCDLGWQQMATKTCVDLAKHCFPCQQETCCRVRASLLCCRRLNCTLDLADCSVPQQGALGLNSTDTSRVYNTSISSGGLAQFPFYAHRNVSYGSSCETERVWGACTCTDGQPVPGCLVNDSSTWLRLGAPSQVETLPSGLSQTCAALQAASPPLPAPPPPPSAGGGGGGPKEQTTAAGGNGPADAPGQRHLSGTQVELLVVLSALGGMVLLAGMGLTAWRLLHAGGTQRGLFDGRLGGGDGGGGSGSAAPNASYHAVFTGQVYTPGLVSEPSLSKGARAPRALVAQALSAMWRARDKVAMLLSKARDTDSAAEARAAYLSHRAQLESRLAATGRGNWLREGPALPTDVEDDELYTLEELDDHDAHMHHSGVASAAILAGRAYGRGRELELAPVDTLAQPHHAHAMQQQHQSQQEDDEEDNGRGREEDRKAKVPLLSGACGLDGGTVVIHTTPVRLDEDDAAGHPMTPQPTGQAGSRGYRGLG